MTINDSSATGEMVPAAPVAVDTAPELPPLPSPWDVCYLWREPIGLHRSFSANHYNGRACDNQVLLYTQAELKEYGDARARAALRAAGAGSRDKEDAERWRWIEANATEVFAGGMGCPGPEIYFASDRDERTELSRIVDAARGKA